MQSIGIGGFFGSAVGALFGYVKTRKQTAHPNEPTGDSGAIPEVSPSTVSDQVFDESELFLILKKTQILCSVQGQALVSELIGLVKKIRTVTLVIEKRMNGQTTSIDLSSSDLNLSCDRLSKSRQFLEKLGLCEKNAGSTGATHRSSDEFNTYLDVIKNELDTFQSILNTHISVFPH